MPGFMQIKVFKTQHWTEKSDNKNLDRTKSKAFESM